MLTASSNHSVEHGKKLAAIRRGPSEVTEECVQERLGLRRRASTVRKASIFESLDKWDTDADVLSKKPQSSRGTRNGSQKKEQQRRKSADESLFLVEEKEEEISPTADRAKSEEPLPSKRSVTSKESASTQDSKTGEKASASPAVTPRREPLASTDSSSTNVSKKKNGSRRIKRATRRKSTSSAAGSVAGASVNSAPSQLPSTNRNGKAKRRASKGPKSSNSLQIGRKPRRSKSSDLDSFAKSPTKAKKNKRRSQSVGRPQSAGPSQSADSEVATAEVTGLEERKGKKGRAKRRNSHKRASQLNDTSENDTAQRQDRRASLSGTKKRSHSAGPLKRKPDSGVPDRAASMMLHRDNIRRGKANSLHNLVQYSADEIHSTSYFASMHVLVNRERMKRGLRPLTRNVAMDTLARESAEAMASTEGTAPLRTTYVGNVLRGESIRAVHRAVILDKQGRDRANMLNPYFQEFGVGTCKGKDDMLYVCQLFSERLELSCTDLTSNELKSD